MPKTAFKEDHMSEQEGVIKYQLNHHYAPLTSDISVTEVNVWRDILYKLNLIGQDEQRYGGLGFGNISQKLPTETLQFVISGTQTGHLAQLSRHDYCLVTRAFPQDNRIDSTGECQPSSEALTHASVYLQDAFVQAVIHVHSPAIWKNTHALQLAHTPEDVAYGTPAMANAVAQLVKTQSWQHAALFTMLGHEDGVIAFGTSLTEAADILIKQLSVVQ
jgi:L-ribulose-5-phosphate 4-epimerase